MSKDSKLPTVFVGKSHSADFGENTWTFEMTSNFKVKAGNHVIIDEEDFNEIINELKELRHLASTNA
jgi:tetrahydromethanopterin S-methyltransferase subunit G